MKSTSRREWSDAERRKILSEIFIWVYKNIHDFIYSNIELKVVLLGTLMTILNSKITNVLKQQISRNFLYLELTKTSIQTKVFGGGGKYVADCHNYK